MGSYYGLSFGLVGLSAPVRGSNSALGGFLERYPGASAAYSTRQLRNGITRCMRVRRSSDNEERDFAPYDLPSGALAEWVGAGDGFVSKWYDQTENQNHLEQTFNVARQPKIVVSGVLLLSGLKFAGSALKTTKGYAVELSQNPASVFVVTKSNTIFGPILAEADVDAYSSNFTLGGTNGDDILSVNGSRFGQTYPTIKALAGFIYNGSTFQAYLNGGPSGAAGSALINAEVNFQTYIGSDAREEAENYWSGSIHEIIIYKSDQTANLVGMNQDINKHFNIYGNQFYLRPDGLSLFRRPDTTSLYKRPLGS